MLSNFFLTKIAGSLEIETVGKHHKTAETDEHPKKYQNALGVALALGFANGSFDRVQQHK